MDGTFLNYIGGRWTPPKSEKSFQRENPATGETIGIFPDSGPEDVADPRRSSAR